MHASRPFAKLDHLIFRALWRWALRRHPNKGRRWVKRRYFRSVESRDWLFQSEGHRLVLLSKIPVGRYVKIRSDANPYDPVDEVYFDERLTRRMKASLMGRRKLYWLWTKQGGCCPECGTKLSQKGGWHVHHKIWRVFGGTDRLSNLQLLHPTCHVQLHARDPKG